MLTVDEYREARLYKFAKNKFRIEIDREALSHYISLFTKPRIGKAWEVTLGENPRSLRHCRHSHLITVARQTRFTLMADTAATMITRLDSPWLDLTSLDFKKFSGGAYIGPQHDHSYRMWVEWGERAWPMPSWPIFSLPTGIMIFKAVRSCCS